MSLSLLLRLAWRQSLIRLLLFYALALAVGLALDEPWWALGLATAVVALRAYWRLYRVLRFLDWRKQLQTVDGQGLWAALETLIHRRQTENRARTRRLVRLLRAYRQAATAMPDGALIVNRHDGRLVWFNKTARHLLGLRYPQSLDTPLAEVFEGQPRVRDWFAAGITDEPLTDLPSPAEPMARLSLRLIPYSPTQWLVVVRDVTKLMRLEQVRRDFVANVSHELRTPLTVVHGYLDMIEPDEHPELAHMVEEMRRQSQRMTQLVEDLLTLSRLEAQESLPEEPLAMAPMLVTLRREAEALSQGRHQVLVEDRAGVDLTGSTKELHSAFSNLVSNAVRYTPTGGRILIRFERSADGGARLAVQDSGYGIPAQHLPRITERFYRVSTSRSRESGGTGLGLSIVKHVLSLHQARLEIESEVGRGSTFACAFGPARVRQRETAEAGAGGSVD
ncbi:phosphate regulon sensor histidine kinase PhoR [Arenimonas fontis]|uniref:Phosphate regulon sensor protein PhoR n=1 Tax=Arenimonas fontis TaxID=2608255 RepID=A0A5B2ZEA1_9GAMM|nr:phosphate regulon sensor histidine kinase PhoR [Arenimonas fontis]KAA2285584.1 phosphate regulon sensor histidine kinase PhoR [Arenimonas fontis]